MGTDEIPLERPVSLSVSSEISCLTAATKQAKLVAIRETTAVKNIKENANIVTFPIRNVLTKNG
jgi:putative N-acetylmannosamine-6-phosphate epimerase